jgi:nitroreductase
MQDHDAPQNGRTKPVTSETIEALLGRVSVRDYEDRPVGDATVDAVLAAAFRAPTSSNIQAYSVVIVRDPAVRAKLVPITGNQRWVGDAPVFLAFCADLTRIEEAARRNGHDLNNNNFEAGLVASVDAALVGMAAYIAAESIGLRGVMIGAVRNDIIATAEALALPPRVYCLFGMCLGWAETRPEQKPRMEYEAMVHYDRYGNQPALEGGPSAALDRYDRTLAAHYEAIGKPTAPDSWTHDIDKKFHARLRDQLRAQLKQRGFDFA